MIYLGKDETGADFELPADATQKIAIVGISDSGKSYAAGVFAEGWFQSGVPVAIVDPVGIWWGLRSGADRDPQKGFPFIIYGGGRADAKLPDPWAGAQKFATDNACCIFDLSASTLEYAHWWAANFFMKLMELGPKLDSTRMVIVEEAPALAPQSGVTSKWCSQCKNSLAHLVRVGGNHGYGVTIVTQRAQAVDKNVLTQCGNLLLMRIAADLDRKAIDNWVANNADIKKETIDKMMKEMSTLPTGVGWLWAPTWKGAPEMYARVTVRPRYTFHPDRRDPLGNRGVRLSRLVREDGPKGWVGFARRFLSRAI